MPVTIKSAQMKYKDTNEQYVTIDALSDQTTAAKIAAIESAGTTQVGLVNSAGTTKVGAVNDAGATQVAAVQAKGAETLASIPSDYTTLSDDVAELNSALTQFRFNQLVVNGNFEDASGWKANGSTSWNLSASDNVLTGEVLSKVITLYRLPSFNDYPTIVVGHKYFFNAEYYGSDFSQVAAQIGTARKYGSTEANTWNRLSVIIEPTSVSGDQSDCALYVNLVQNYTVSSIQFRNFWVTDLTEAFGAGNEPTVSDFIALFSEAYYPYTDLTVDSRIYNYANRKIYENADNIRYELDTAKLIYKYTTTPGYISSNGSISGQNATNLELTTNKIPVTAGDVIQYVEKHTSRHDLWAAYGLYDSNESFISDSRTVFYNSANTSHSATITIENTSAKYIVFSYRSWGDGTMTLFNPIEDKLNGKIGQIKSDVAELQTEVNNGGMNQILVNGNFESATGWKFNGSPSWNASASGNVLTGTVASKGVYLQRLATLNDYPKIKVNHRYYVNVEYYGSDFDIVCAYIGKSGIYGVTTANTWNKISGVVVPSEINDSQADCELKIELVTNYTATTVQVRNFWVTDLTEMFGEGNEPTAEEFAVLYSDSYYSYLPIKHNTVSSFVAEKNTYLSAYAKNEGRFKPCYDHLFVTDSQSNITIPHESIYHIRLSKRFGFDIIEANVQETYDGVYFVNHLGSDGKFGDFFQHVDGTTDISNMKPSEKTWEWITENVRYTSSISKYRTRPCTLEEFLQECRQQNIIPLVQIKNQEIADIVVSVMGHDNFIGYTGNSQYCPSAMRTNWVSKTTKAEIIAYCENCGRPFIYSMANTSNFTDEQLAEIIEELHARGFYISTAYDDQNWYKYSALGFDFIAGMAMVNRIESGNICNLSTIFGFDDFTFTNATESNGVLTFSADGTISPDIENTTYQVAMFDLQISFVGSITIGAIGERFSNITYTSDGSIPVFVTVPVINGSVKPTIAVTSGTVITDISFKASEV